MLPVCAIHCVTVELFLSLLYIKKENKKLSIAGGNVSRQGHVLAMIWCLDIVGSFDTFSTTAGIFRCYPLDFHATFRQLR